MGYILLRHFKGDNLHKKRAIQLVILGILLLVVCFAIPKVICHYQTKQYARKVLDQYIAIYGFPSNKITVQKMYAPMDVAEAYRKEIHIKGNKEDYYVFTYYTDRKKVDLTGVIEGGEWLDPKDHRYKSLPYQPSKKFLKMYYNQ